MTAARRDPLPDFRALCKSACIKLWGEPTSRDRKELRWNGCDAYSAKTFSFKKKAWYDHGAGWGGSTLDLVAYSKGQPKQEQLRGKAFIDAWRDAHAMGLVPVPPPEQPPNGGGGPILATYPYHDESGAILFEVVRFDTADPKHRFSQRRPDGKGGVIWDIKGVRRVLYRLPELIAAVKAGQRVYICEGERDSNTAVALGCVATTMPGGVGKWRTEYDKFFRGGDVVVVSDNDPQAKDPNTGKPQFHPNGKPVLPGQDHAANVVRRMLKVAAHVRTIIFPQKDLTLWRDAGGTRAALDALTEAAPDLIRQPPPDAPPGPDDAADEAEIERLARLSLFDYARERKGAAQRLGTVSPVNLLDKIIEAKRRELKRQQHPDDDAPGGLNATLEELHRDHSVVIIGSKTRVLRFEDTLHFAGGERYVYRLPNYLKFEDFRNYYLNRYCIDDNGEPFAVDMFGNPLHIGHWWLDHPARRTYHGVTFLPGGEPVIDDWLNLWTGLASGRARASGDG